ITRGTSTAMRARWRMWRMTCCRTADTDVWPRRCTRLRWGRPAAGSGALHPAAARARREGAADVTVDEPTDQGEQDDRDRQVGGAHPLAQAVVVLAQLVAARRQPHR